MVTEQRLWDEAGKLAGMKTQAFRGYAPLLQHVVDRFRGLCQSNGDG